MTRTENYEARVARGDIPRGWRTLSPKMKLAIKFKAMGFTDSEACRRARSTTESFYRWRRAHPSFGRILARAEAEAHENWLREIDALLPRAVKILRDALESGDPRLEYSAALWLLKTAGVYRSGLTSSQSPVTQHRTAFPREQPPDLETSRAVIDAFIADFKSRKENGNSSED